MDAAAGRVVTRWGLVVLLSLSAVAAVPAGRGASATSVGVSTGTAVVTTGAARHDPLPLVRVTGSVRGPTAAPWVLVTFASAGRSVSAATGGLGRYRLSLAPGEYRVTCVADRGRCRPLGPDLVVVERAVPLVVDVLVTDAVLAPAGAPPFSHVGVPWTGARRWVAA